MKNPTKLITPPNLEIFEPQYYIDKILKSDLKRLDSVRFTIYNYCGVLDIPVYSYRLDKSLYDKSKFELLGYCLGGKVQQKQRPDCIALMMMDLETNEVFWFHELPNEVYKYWMKGKCHDGAI